MASVLIIEDDIEIQDIYTRKLTQEGLDVKTCTTAEEGLQSIAADKPDLILLDLMLPGGKNGFDILEQLKQEDNTKDIPVIILTNLDGEQDSAMAIGASDYIIKANTSLEEMVEKIKSLVPITNAENQ